MARPEGPLRADSRDLGEFAADLRALRERAGSPTYRRLARDAHYSAAALSEAANGRKLPSLAVTLAYVRACGGDAAAWEARWRALAERLADANPRTPPEGTKAPYPGLAPFQVRDADRFFGRDRVVREVVGLVGQRRFAGVFGASGSGKSSVLRAGLVAMWDRPSVVLTPGTRPVEELAVRVAASTGRDAPALVAEFTAHPGNLHLRVRQALVGGDDDLLIVVDQFEEVFTLCQDPAERAAFITALTTAASAPTSRTRVVLGVRADFLGHCGQYPELVEALRGGHVLVGPMTADELREAIVSPAVAVGCKVETALVTRLVADAAGQPAALPLVSHALLETWRRRRGVALTLAGYEEVGGVEHSIARSAEHVYTAMGPAGQLIAKQVFLRLIAVGEGTEDTKRRVARAEVDHHAEGDGAAVLAALAQARLVVLDRDAVELAHEALIRNWPRLRDWIAEDRAGLRVQRMLTEAAHTWETLDRDPGALYRGARLALVREWVDGTRGLTPGEIRFLEASIAADDAVRAIEHRRTRRLRQLVSVMAVLLVLASSAIVFAVRAERSATEQRNIALAHKVITQAAALRDTDPALSWQLTLAAHRLAPLPETEDALFAAFTGPYATRVGAVRTMAVSPAASLLAVVDDTTTADVRLMDITDPHRPEHIGVLTGMSIPKVLAFSDDGRWLAGASEDYIVVWRVTDPRHPVITHRLSDLSNGPTLALAFSPDARHLVAGFLTAPARAWDLAGRGTRVELPPTAQSSGQVVFIAEHVVAVDAGDRVLAVDLATGTSGVLVDGVGAVTALAVGDGGRVLATAGEDRVVRLWDAADRGGPARQTAALRHGGDVRALAFDGDARVLATAGDDRSARLWDVTDRHAPVEAATLDGHLDVVTALAFTDEGRALVTTGSDRAVRLTDLTDLPVAHPATLLSVVVAADRGLAATVDVEGVLRLVDISEPRGPRTAWPLTAHPGPVRAAALSPDGEHLVTVGEDTRVRVWRTANPASPDLVGEAGRANLVAFSPKGGHFATGGLEDGVTRLWNAATTTKTAELVDEANPELVTSALAFDRTGDRLVVAKHGGSVEEWDTATPMWPRRIRRDGLDVAKSFAAVASAPGGVVTVESDGKAVLWRHPEEGHEPGDDSAVRFASAEPLGPAVRAVAVHDDLLVVADADGNLRLHDVPADGPVRRSAVFAAHSSGANSVAFAPDGHTLVSAGGSALRFWETDLDEVVRRICATAHPGITGRQWAGYFPDVPYDPPCDRP
ncbi:helix-turn-helix domain-containing protein [Saccharothrix texasensis]|uniref:WD-40 repeat-containing protein n=1 Tax=Saccharothrix texasensis TaxID=103734 RepID=A0A3N1HFE4_9PSEU|nr:helix-turn-helix domain-containing protein [Saccharothrix texasensis]ROP41197.1 WD-40 repeat-containing protein [Saccharothrix texasensis]